MGSQNVTCGKIKTRFNVLCNKGVFQNAVKRARAAARSEQARSLRDVVRESNVWGSEIHSNAENVFVEAFFANSVLAAKKLSVTFVYVDGMACSNTFDVIRPDRANAEPIETTRFVCCRLETIQQKDETRTYQIRPTPMKSGMDSS